MEAPAAELLDTSVAIERQRGVVTVYTLIEYPKATEKEFEVLLPQTEDYLRAVSLSALLFSLGKAVPAIDVLIASMALNRRLTVLAKDRHFLTIREVEPNLEVRIPSE